MKSSWCFLLKYLLNDIFIINEYYILVDAVTHKHKQNTIECVATFNETELVKHSYDNGINLLVTTS